MLGGILNSLISARYISTKVSGNCFVLLEQRVGGALAAAPPGDLLAVHGLQTLTDHLYASPHPAVGTRASGWIHRSLRRV